MSADNQGPTPLPMLPIEFLSFDSAIETTVEQVVFICDVHIRLHGREMTAEYRFDLSNGSFRISTQGQTVSFASVDVLNALLHRISETNPEVLHAQTH